MQPVTRIVSIAVCLTIACSRSLAEPKLEAGAPSVDETPPQLIASAGVLALADNHDFPYMVELQYRGRPRTRWLLRPTAGLAAGRDGAGYLSVGLAREFELSGPWLLTLAFDAGGFDNGETFGVVHHLEFRSGIALSWRFPTGTRLGLRLSHISNGGISRPNKGTEGLALYLAIPLRRER